MSGYVPLPAPVTADPGFWQKGLEGLNALRDTQAKQAIAGIYQQSTDPATGQVDPAKFNLLISRNPQAAWAAGSAMQQQGQAQSAQGMGAQEQLAAHRARMDSMLGLMNGVLAKGGPVGMGDIQNAVNQAHLSPTEAAQVAQDINTTAAGDPNYDFTNWVKGHQASNLDAQKQIAARTPNITFHNIGGRLVPVDMNGQTNPNPGSLITTLSPGEATQIVKVDMGDGTTQQMPLSDAVTKLSTNPAMRILGPTTGGGGGGSTDPIAGLPKNQALSAIVQRESADQNVNTRILGSDGKPASTASGYYQMLDSTWQEGAALAGIKNPPPRAMNASRADQDAAASALYDKYGTAPWAKSAPGARIAAAAPPPTASSAPPAPPAGPPGVQMGGAPPPPPGGAPGPYTGGGIGAALAPGGGANPVVVRGTPIPAGRLSGDVGAMVQGMQLARANPLQQSGSAMVAGPGAPTGNNPLVSSVELPPRPGWGSGVGTYSGGPGPAAAPAARPAAPATLPQASPAPVQPPAATQPAPTIGRSAPLGLPTTIEGRAKASVEMANAMHAQASQSPQRQALLADMEATNKQINTNPAAEAEARWGSFVNSLPDNISSLIPGMSRAQVAGTEGFAKLAETFRQMQAGGIAGTLTNDKFASALASNPHLALSTLGNQGMIHLLQGSEDALQYKDRSWIAASGANPSLDYQSWETNFNKSFDPRVFWWSRMERPEQQRLMGGMGDQQKQTLLAHLKQAEADGLITRSGGQGG